MVGITAAVEAAWSGGFRARRNSARRAEACRSTSKGPTVKTFRLTLLAALFTLASLPLFAQVNDTYVIPAVANQDGGFGTRWQTTFSLFNPSFDHELQVSVTFLPTGGKPGVEKLVPVPANSLTYSDNILKDLYGINSGGGSLLVATFPEDNPGIEDKVLSRAFLVTSNTYNNARTGTFGTTVPGVWTGLLDDGISAIAQNVRNDAAFRTNIGAVNLGRCNATLRVTVYDADGHTILNQAPFIVPPLGHFQDGLPVQTEAGTVEFLVDDPCRTSNTDYAVVFPYTSTNDNRSGDPSYQTPSLLAGTSILASSKLKAQTLANAQADPTKIGKKIDTAYARGVLAQVERLGDARLTRDSKGWHITQ
jgi:hypothetical protein